MEGSKVKHKHENKVNNGKTNIPYDNRNLFESMRIIDFSVNVFT